LAPKDGGAHTGSWPSGWARTGTVTATVNAPRRSRARRPRALSRVELTIAGRRLAIAAIRRHRIVERFLADMLGYAWNESRSSSDELEHELPQEVEDRLFVARRPPRGLPARLPDSRQGRPTSSRMAAALTP